MRDLRARDRATRRRQGGQYRERVHETLVQIAEQRYKPRPGAVLESGRVVLREAGNAAGVPEYCPWMVVGMLRAVEPAGSRWTAWPRETRSRLKDTVDGRKPY